MPVEFVGHPLLDVLPRPRPRRGRASGSPRRRGPRRAPARKPAPGGAPPPAGAARRRGAHRRPACHGRGSPCPSLRRSRGRRGGVGRRGGRARRWRSSRERPTGSWPRPTSCSSPRGRPRSRRRATGRRWSSVPAVVGVVRAGAAAGARGVGDQPARTSSPGRAVVPELIQGRATAARRRGRPRSLLLEDEAARAAQRAALREVRARLGEAGAGRRAARAVLRERVATPGR